MASRVVQPGQAVTVTGDGFSDSHAGSNAGDSLVTLRLKARNGAVLQDNVDVTNRNISTTVKIPADMAPGYYVMLGTQTKADGSAKAGTPARFAFRVAGAAASSVVASPWSGASNGPTSSSVTGNGGLDGQPLLIGGILSLTLLGAGSVLVARRNTHTNTLGA